MKINRDDPFPHFDIADPINVQNGQQNEVGAGWKYRKLYDPIVW